jgi:ABC-2 type transport system permease protein
VSTFELAEPRRLTIVGGEIAKLGAFLRRDFLVALSYRFSFVSDIVGLVSQALMFYFVGLMVDPSKLPSYGGSQVSYLEFVAIGIALSVFLHVGLVRVGTAVRGEQLMGTLESVLMTPTATGTIQLGSVVFDLIYVPLRTALFLVAIAVVFGLHFDVSGIPPAAAVLLAFIPFVWGLGVASAAMTLTFRRGANIATLALTMVAALSGAYFPLTLLPDWLADVARLNPIALAIDGMRDALLAGGSWDSVAPGLALLVPLSVLSLLLGVVAFRLAVRRERSRGTLGLY